MEILARFALHEDRIGPDLEDLLLGKDRRASHVLEGGDEGAVRFEPLVPPTQLPGEAGANENLIDRRVEPDPLESFGKRRSIIGKKSRPFRILKIADPVRHAEMTQIRDRPNPQLS